MSSPQERDHIDYFDDDAHHEDGTIFIPVPNSAPDTWTGFYCGILIGIAGGMLASLSLWLAGVLIFAGYLLTALTLKRNGNRFVRSLRFGFGISALAGAAIFTGDIFFPNAAWRFVSMAGDRSLMFVSVAFLPWFLGMLRYFYAVLRGEKRFAQVRAA
jgi:hypothetical protein